MRKRGSAARPSQLFKAEAERKLKNSSKRNIIYAIEEPETSQHPNNQRILIEALKDLASESNCQVVITTHSPGLAAELRAEDIRFIARDTENKLSIQAGAPIFGVVADALGVTPDSRVKVLFCADVCAFRALSNPLHRAGANIPDLTTDDRVAFVVLGGSTLNQWVAENHLRALRIPEFHIYDRDVPAYEIAQQEMTVHVPTNIKTRNRVLSAYRRHSGRVRSDCTSH
jgi:putative ATP-dependent endonuclease of the OLD family